MGEERMKVTQGILASCLSKRKLRSYEKTKQHDQVRRLQLRKKTLKIKRRTKKRTIERRTTTEEVNEALAERKAKGRMAKAEAGTIDGVEIEDEAATVEAETGVRGIAVGAGIEVGVIAVEVGDV